MLCTSMLPAVTPLCGHRSSARPRRVASLPPALLLACALLTLLGLAPAQSAVDVVLTSAPGVVDLGPGFLQQPAWLYGGTLPGPVLRATEGQTLRVLYRNQLDQPSTVHFHGVGTTLAHDGAGGLPWPSVAPGQVRRYEFANLRPGTYWYHAFASDHWEQADKGLYGALIVDPLNPATDPPADVDRVVVLDDWAQPLGGTYGGHLMNGGTSLAQTPIAVANGQRLRLRFVNASGRSNYVVALDGHSFEVTHCDGRRVQSVVVPAIPLGIGERVDAIVACSNPGTWSLAVALVQNRNTTVVRGIVDYTGQSGTTPSATYVPPSLATGALLSYAQLASAMPSPIAPLPNLQLTMLLDSGVVGGQQAFRINGQEWPNVLPLQVAQGDVVQLDFVSTIASPGGLHPLHLHGHAMRLLTAAGGATNAPTKDTVLLWPAGQPGDALSVQFTADNPGRWLLNCGDLQQLGSGMMTAIEYAGDYDGDGIADAVDLDPVLPLPQLFLPDDGAAFLPGGTGTMGMQWLPAQGCNLLASIFLQPAPVALPPHGLLYLASVSFLGFAIGDSGGNFVYPFGIPPLVGLSGLQVHLQGLAGSNFQGVVRLSSLQTLTIR